MTTWIKVFPWEILLKAPFLYIQGHIKLKLSHDENIINTRWSKCLTTWTYSLARTTEITDTSEICDMSVSSNESELQDVGVFYYFF